MSACQIQALIRINCFRKSCVGTHLWVARERNRYCSHPRYFQFRLFIATLTETNTIHKTGFETALFSELMTRRLMEICQFLPAGIWPDFAGKENCKAKKLFGFLKVCDGCLLSLYSLCFFVCCVYNWPALRTNARFVQGQQAQIAPEFPLTTAFRSTFVKPPTHRSQWDPLTELHQ